MPVKIEYSEKEREEAHDSLIEEFGSAALEYEDGLILCMQNRRLREPLKEAVEWLEILKPYAISVHSHLDIATVLKQAREALAEAGQKLA